MKFAGFLVLSLFAVTISRADIIANGDFHDGKAHWKGDIRMSAGADDSNLLSPVPSDSSAPGLTVNLNPRSLWPHVYQTFNSRDTTLNYSLTFTVSKDYAPKQVKPDRGVMWSDNLLASLLKGNYKSDLKPPKGNDFMILVVDLTEGLYSEATITPQIGSTDPQTVTGTLKGVPAHDEKELFLVFNHGPGSVTLLNVALTPAPPDASAESNSIPKP